MENAQLIGLSRQVALRRELDVVANNVANINTAGFKRHSVVFEDYLMPVAAYDARLTRDEPLHYVSDRATIRDFSPGGLQQTGNPLDVALKGKGWLAITTPDGERYTRNGALTVNPEGMLVTQSGDRVQGEGGDIVIPDESTSISIARDGTISADGDVLGRIRVVEFENDADILADQGSLFRSDVAPLAADRTAVVQGFVERSNVQGVREISRLIEINRAYESLSRSLERTDRLRRTAIETLGQVQA